MPHSAADIENPFPSVIGQEKIKQKLIRILDSSRLAHAYLFVGPQGTGRLAMALELARALNCSKENIIERLTACDCRQCRGVMGWNHPNLIPLFPLPPFEKDKGEAAHKALQEMIETKRADVYSALKLTGTGRILIDQIRELRHKLALAADRPGVRMILVQPADRIREEAANAFLKILEEPPGKCCIILISESTRDLLPTVLSRCQVIKFPPLDKDEIVQGLKTKFDLSLEEAFVISRLASGNFTHAIALTEGNAAEILSESLEFLRISVVGNALKIAGTVNTWSTWTERSQIDEKLSYAAMWIRDAVAWKSFGAENAPRHLTIKDSENAIERMANRYTHLQLYHAWKEIENTRLAIDANASIPLTLTALALRLNRTLR